MDCQNSARTKEGETKHSCKGMQRQNVSPRDHRTASWAEQAASEGPGITEINSRKARYLIEGGVLGLNFTGNATSMIGLCQEAKALLTRFGGTRV